MSCRQVVEKPKRLPDSHPSTSPPFLSKLLGKTSKLQILPSKLRVFPSKLRRNGQKIALDYQIVTKDKNRPHRTFRAAEEALQKFQIKFMEWVAKK